VKTVLCRLGDSRNSPSLACHLWYFDGGAGLLFVNPCSSSSSSEDEGACVGRSVSLSDMRCCSKRRPPQLLILILFNEDNLSQPLAATLWLS